MKGQLLNFNIQQSEGVISAEDGNRYKFPSSEWKEESTPQKGMHLDFLVTEEIVTEVYIDSSSPSILKESSWYKSSDNKIIAGVCYGIGHKQQVSISAIRIATVLLTIFFLFPLVLYIVFWILLPPKRTHY